MIFFPSCSRYGQLLFLVPRVSCTGFCQHPWPINHSHLSSSFFSSSSPPPFLILVLDSFIFFPLMALFSLVFFISLYVLVMIFSFRFGFYFHPRKLPSIIHSSLFFSNKLLAPPPYLFLTIYECFIFLYPLHYPFSTSLPLLWHLFNIYITPPPSPPASLLQQWGSPWEGPHVVPDMT